MKFVNRCVVSLKPKQPFMDWAVSIETEIPEDWTLEGGAYLLDEQETEEGLRQVLKAHASEIFENELSAWEEDRSKWPETRNMDTLKEWFDLHVSVAGFDLGQESLMVADLDDMDVM